MPTIKDLNKKGLDSDEIGEIAFESHAKGLEMIDWENLSDEQVELIMNDHDCSASPMDGCAVCQKLYDNGKIRGEI